MQWVATASRAPDVAEMAIVYTPNGNHVAALLVQAVYHIEHLRLGIAATPADAASRRPQAD